MSYIKNIIKVLYFKFWIFLTIDKTKKEIYNYIYKPKNKQYTVVTIEDNKEEINTDIFRVG